MPLRGARRYTLSERVRLRLEGLLKPHGTAARITTYIQNSPLSSRGLTAQQLSMFMSGTRRLTVDSLEDLAAALRISIPYLLGVPDESGLSADEQRLIVAFRALSPTHQDHLRAMAELASVAEATDSLSAVDRELLTQLNRLPPEEAKLIREQMQGRIKTLIAAAESRSDTKSHKPLRKNPTK